MAMMLDIDRSIMQLLAPLINSPQGDIWGTFADFAGNGGWLALAAAVAGVAALFMNCRRIAVTSAAVLVALAASGMTVQLLKFLIGRARPNLELFSMTFIPFSTANNWHSFPSGHATSCFALASVLACFYPKHVIMWYLFASVTSLGRVISLSHFPTDIVGGAILGTALGLIAAKHIETIFSNRYIHSSKFSSE